MSTLKLLRTENWTMGLFIFTAPLMRDAGVKGHLFISWINLTITAVQHPCQCAGVSQWLSVAAPHFCHRDDAWGLFWVKKKTCRSQEHLKWERDYVEITIDLYFHINALFLALISIFDKQIGHKKISVALHRVLKSRCGAGAKKCFHASLRSTQVFALTPEEVVVVCLSIFNSQRIFVGHQIRWAMQVIL